jgi:hypothetical protein
MEYERFLPEALIPDLAHAEAAGRDMVLAGMDAVARLTGVPVADWPLTSDGPIYPLITAVADLAPVYPEYCRLRRTHPDLLTRLVAAPTQVQRALAEWAAGQALEATSLATDHRVVAVTSGFGGQTPARFDAADGLLAEASRENDLIARSDPSRFGGHVSPQMRAAWMRLHALNALRYATTTDPVSAAIGATEALAPFLQHNDEVLAQHITRFLDRY